MKRLALVILNLTWILAGPLAEGSFKYVQQGMDAPAVEVVSLDGRSVRVADLYGRGGTIVVFWALWSPRSLEQLTDLARAYDSLQAQGVEVVAVSVDKQKFDGSLIANIRLYTEQQQIPFPTYVDQGLRLFYAYGIIATPSSAVIDPQNRVLYELSGYSMFGADTMVQTALAVLGLTDEAPDTLPEVRFPERRAVRYFGMGRKMLKRNPGAARGFFQQAAEIDSQYAAAFYYVSLTAELTGDMDAALTAAQTAAELEAANAVYLVRWAYLAAHHGDTAQALQLARRAHGIDTTYLEAHALLAEFSLNKAELDAAAAYIADGMKIDSENLHLEYLEGRRLTETGDTAAALKLYREALDRVLDGR